MPVGVPETEVFAAADRVLARGERPTVERVRAELGRGSPARVGQLLETWWDALAKRLTGHVALPDLPEGVASAFAQVWEQAVSVGRTTAEQEVAAERAALAALMQALREEARQQTAELIEAQAEANRLRAAAHEKNQQVADLQQRIEQQVEELAAGRTQREALRARVLADETSLMELRSQLHALRAEANAERTGWREQIQALEDRAHREIDRARQELKAAKAEGAAAAKASLRRERALQDAVQKAERMIAAQASKLAAVSRPGRVERRAVPERPPRATRPRARKLS